ncbi:hypothetical protein CHELA40_10927 [Chelatococcus asaccharovorans]|nr:hypothetical protein CHELA40_10927 [Chelatococcus asaccharovorans]CAH1685769.1 hypothetical protein CHELA17_64672 [Chelatococcus asaccharovorans]
MTFYLALCTLTRRIGRDMAEIRVRAIVRCNVGWQGAAAPCRGCGHRGREGDRHDAC